MSEITITREQFLQAVADANEQWRKTPAADGSENVFAEYMMWIQNMAFGLMLEEKLFGDEDDENKEDN